LTNLHQERTPSIYPLSFFLILVSILFVYFSIHMLATVLPLYVQGMGAPPSQVGLVMGVFSLVTLSFRPFVGPLIDRVGRKPLMIFGSALYLLASLSYALSTSVPTLFLGRVIHGVGQAAFGIAYVTLAADLVPFSHRGQALSLIYLAPPAALMMGPPLGALLLRRIDYALVFGISAALAGLGLLIALLIHEASPLETRSRSESVGFLTVLRYRNLWAPCLLMIPMGLAFGAVYTFLPLFGVERGIANVGPFFTLYGLTILLVRMPLGTLSDRIGRVRIIVPGVILVALSVLGLNAVHTTVSLMLMGSLFGLGFSGSWSLNNALVVDRVPLAVRGTALALAFAGFDLGNGVGSIALGYLAAAVGYGGMYLVVGLVVLATVVAFAGLIRRQG